MNVHVQRGGGGGDQQAVLRYHPFDFEIIVPGTYVVCSETHRRIPLEELRYWNVERQEAYADIETAIAAYERERLEKRRSNH